MKILNKFQNTPLFRWQIVVLASIYGSYSVLNFLRTTIIVASPQLLDDPTINLNKAMWGSILGWGTAGTLIGKLTTGFLADRFGGRKVFLISIGICILAIGLFGVVSKYAFFFTNIFYFHAR